MKLSFAQEQALRAAADSRGTDWVRANTITSLINRGLIRWVDNRNAYENGRGGYITTPAGRELVEEKSCARRAGHPGSCAVHCTRSQGCTERSGHAGQCTTGTWGPLPASWASDTADKCGGTVMFK